mgnify:FL=1
MGIFRRNQIDLSDEGLALAAEDSNVIKEAAADEGQTNIRDHSSAVNSLAAAGGLSTEDDLPAQETGQELEEQQPALSAEQKAEREALWQEAAASVAASWPQAMGQGQQLIAKMVEISQRYGDAQLWQRVPAGIMREAAIELYGMPLSRDNEYARIAAQSAREAALEEMNRRNQAKAGLEKRRGRQTHPPALTEEEKIIEQISQARGGSIF